MSDLPASNERPRRRAARLTLGVMLGFAVAQLIAWPPAFLVPVVATVLLQDAAPMSVRGGWLLLRNSAFFIILGGLITWLLTPWPPILVIVSVFMVYAMFLHMLMFGAPLMEVIATLIGFIVIPVLVVMLPELGFLAMSGFLLDFAVGVLIAWVAWLFMPLEKAPPDDHHDDPLIYRDAVPFAITLSTVMGLLLIVFLVMGWTKILILVYGIIFATSFSSVAGREMGLSYIIANVFYGGVAMLICYELIVMVPSFPFTLALVALTVFFFSTRLFGGGPTAVFWSSGLFGFIILLGGQLLSEGASTAALMGRVWQMVLATLYVAFAFSVVEWIRSWSTGKHTTQKGEVDGPIKSR